MPGCISGPTTPPKEQPELVGSPVMPPILHVQVHVKPLTLTNQLCILKKPCPRLNELSLFAAVRGKCFGTKGVLSDLNKSCFEMDMSPANGATGFRPGGTEIRQANSLLEISLQPNRPAAGCILHHALKRNSGKREYELLIYFHYYWHCYYCCRHHCHNFYDRN